MKTTIGPYQLLAQLGEGGMGVVWRAEHQLSKQIVALKTVKVAQHKFLRSIRREIQTLASLRHPGVVQILDDGVEDGLPWYAMEFIEGKALNRWCHALNPRVSALLHTSEDISGATFQDSIHLTKQYKNVSLSESDNSTINLPKRDLLPLQDFKLQEILTVVQRVCETLSFVHGEGLVHQDLKPENIVVRADGTFLRR